MKLAWRTLGGRGVFQSNPSLARRVSPMSSVASVSAGRRSVAPTATSSIARAGEIGETDPPGPVSQDLSRHLASRHTGRRRFTASVVTLARDPYHSSAFAKTPPPATGHSPYRAFFAWRSATRFEHCTAWPDDAGLPFSLSSSSDGAPGVLPRPSQVYARCRVDSSRLLPHDARCRSNPLSLRAARRHFCRSGPTCRSCLLIRPD